MYEIDQCGTLHHLAGMGLAVLWAPSCGLILLRAAAQGERLIRSERPPERAEYRVLSEGISSGKPNACERSGELVLVKLRQRSELGRYCARHPIVALVEPCGGGSSCMVGSAVVRAGRRSGR